MHHQLCEYDFSSLTDTYVTAIKDNKKTCKTILCNIFHSVLGIQLQNHLDWRKWSNKLQFQDKLLYITGGKKGDLMKLKAS